MSEISDLDATARLITAGSVEGYRRLRHVDSLIVGSLSVMSAAVALGAREQTADKEDNEATEGAHARGRAEHARRLERLAERLRRSSREPAPSEEEEAWLDELPEDPAYERLQRAVTRILDANEALLAPHAAPEARSFGRKLAYLAPHREWRLALETAALAGVVCFLATALTYGTAWAPARLGALGICIIFLVLSSMQQPQLIAPHLLKGMVAGVAAGTFYRFAIQPTITSTPQLLVSVAPFLLVGGFARASRRTPRCRQSTSTWAFSSPARRARSRRETRARSSKAR